MEFLELIKLRSAVRMTASDLIEADCAFEE